MKREIKLRAWGGRSMFYSNNNIENSPVMQLTWFFNRLREDAPIMQFTGLKDKNGVDIYEGDIMKTPISEILGEVFYKTGVWFVYYSGILMDRYKDSEVIGNIYENPELLNK